MPLGVGGIRSGMPVVGISLNTGGGAGMGEEMMAVGVTGAALGWMMDPAREQARFWAAQ